MNIKLVKLDSGIEIVWAVPLSGFGHVADEQPLPYIHYKGEELTPRFGGEESQRECSIRSLPLPYGKLSENWPLKQKIFNIFRKRVNIYWRNFFNTFCNHEGDFFFLEQLSFQSTHNGFLGKSPMFTFNREFIFEENITVKDTLTAVVDINFTHFHFAPYAELPDSLCVISSSRNTNFKKEIISSTGKAIWYSEKQKNVKFKAGDVVTWHYDYQIRL